MPEFVYAIEIATTADKLWLAITGNDFWQQFSGPVETDWKPGSVLKFFLPNGTQYSEGVILESDPPNLLSHTWPNPEKEQATQPLQRLTWRIESCGPGIVKLTLHHENLTQKDYQGVSQGWPTILATLKGSLET